MVGSSASAFRTWDSERAPAATLEATQYVQALSLSTTSEGTTPRQSLANTRILRALESRDQPEGRLSREVAQAEGSYGIRMETQRKVVLSTGYYDVPNLLNVPGEELDKVLHYYKEAHP